MSVACGVRNNRVWRNGNVVYCWAVLDRLPLSAIGFSHQENGGVTGHSAGDHEMLRLLISHGFDALKGFFIYGVLSHSVKRFWKTRFYLDGRYAVDSADTSWTCCPWRTRSLIQWEQMSGVPRLCYTAVRDRAWKRGHGVVSFPWWAVLITAAKFCNYLPVGGEPNSAMYFSKKCQVHTWIEEK